MAPLRTLGPKQAASLDADLMSASGGFSIDQLMELAGLSCSQAVYKMLPTPHTGTAQRAPRVLIAAGPGNNGGDGLVCARHLVHYGYDVRVWLPKQSKNELYARLRKQLENLHVMFVDEFPEDLSADAATENGWRAELVVDAIFGFSFSGAVREPFVSAIEALASSSRKFGVLAVDAPSSWDIESGPPDEGPGRGYMPDALISLTAPKPCVKHFTGGRHFVGGRFLSRDVAERYGLDLPAYVGVEQIVEVDAKL